MRLTLDWDTEEERAAHYDGVRERPGLDDSRPWELRNSSSSVGYHYVEWGAAGGWPAVAAAREEHGDDPKRLKLDKKRHDLGSPFLQVLYSVKYMDRWGWQPETGLHVERIDGTPIRDETERVKDPESGTLDYHKLLRLMLEQTTQSEVADRTALKSYADDRGGRSRSTVSDYARGVQSFASVASSHPLKRVVRRWARSNDVGHFLGDESRDDVEFFDKEEKPQRRTIVEYADAPWDWDIGGEDREYALLNVHTGTYNENHSEEQLKHIHDDVMEHVLDLLSPENPESGQRLDLDRETRHSISREQDSVNYEDARLDRDEAAYYKANFVNRTGAADRGVTTQDADRYPLIEVILWDENMTGLHWHFLGVWTGDGVGDVTVVTDSNGWW